MYVGIVERTPFSTKLVINSNKHIKCEREFSEKYPCHYSPINEMFPQVNQLDHKMTLLV